MPAIKSSSIRDLKDRINIFDVVSREITLKRAGSSFKGLSPFTNEKTPSFFISPDKGLYKCFSTGNAGDVISFVMETERLNFTEAVETLAKRFNVELDYEESNRPQEDRSLRQELFDLHDFVADYYHQSFNNATDESDWIRNYWTENRKFDLSIAEDFKIGYAPVSGRKLGEAVLKKGFSQNAIEGSGLFYTRRGLRADTMGYRFRGRLMIPIRDHQSRITAFTARQLEVTPQDDPSREAKYVNSPETPIFNKGRLLFNMDRARMEVGDETPFVMVEGQLDAIRCWSEGLKGVVAPQGTGITENQLRLIQRYEPRIRCLLDGDGAGQKAALRMLPLALAQGVEVTFIPLEAGVDPDDLFRDQGKDAINQVAANETDAIAFACQAIAPEGSKLSPQAKAKAARELFAIVIKSESAVAQNEYAKQIADYMELESAAILADFDRFRRGQSAIAPKSQKTEATPAKSPEPSNNAAVYTVERDLVELCATDDTLGREIAHLIDEDWIDTSRPEGELLNFILNEFLHDMWNGPQSLNEHLENADLKKLASSILFETQEHENPTRIANEALKRLFEKHLQKKSKEIKLEIERKRATNDAGYFSLLGELSNLSRIRTKPPQIGVTN